MKQFLIIEKQPVVIAGISTFLSAGFPLLKTTSLLPEEVLNHSSDHKYDAYIISIIANDIDQIINNILHHQNDAVIIIFHNDINTIYAKHYLKLGVKGIISKNATKETFLEGITAVLQNKLFLCEEMKNILTNDFIERKKIGKIEALSKREIEVALMLAKGMSNDEISLTMNYILPVSEYIKQDYLKN